MDTKEKRRAPARGTAAQTGRPPQKKRRAPARKPAAPAPEVVYTQPGPFNRNRFLLQLITVIAVVLALVFGMSIFFKVKTVVVSGAEKYTAWQVREASGVIEGENLLTLSRAQLASRIRDRLPYVAEARVGIKLPDTVNIEIVELDVAYALETDGGEWWLMRSDGVILEKINAADAAKYTKILGVWLQAPQEGMDAVAAEPVPEGTAPTGETLPPVTVKASEQLSAAISIVQYLEENGIIGDAASVDVTNLGAMELWYGERYQVVLGDTTQLSYKIKCMKAAIDKQSDYQTGILDVSFTTWPDEVGFSPFS